MRLTMCSNVPSTKGNKEILIIIFTCHAAILKIKCSVVFRLKFVCLSNVEVAINVDFVVIRQRPVKPICSLASFWACASLFGVCLMTTEGIDSLFRDLSGLSSNNDDFLRTWLESSLQRSLHESQLELFLKLLESLFQSIWISIETFLSKAHFYVDSK